MNFEDFDDFDGVEVVETPSEAAFIETFNAVHCRTRREVVSLRLERFVAERTAAMMDFEPQIALAAAPEGAKAKELPPARAPGEDVVFRFTSNSPGLWQAEVTVPARADAATCLAIALSGGGNGVLELAGMPLLVEGGSAQMPFGAFLSGIRDTNVAYTPAGGERAPGHLALF